MSLLERIHSPADLRALKREEIDALAAEGAKTTAFLNGLDDAGWEAPTRCPPWRVREIVIHMITMLEFMRHSVQEDRLDIEPAKDRVTWWDYDIDEDKSDAIEWIKNASKEFPDGPLADRWQSAFEGAVEAGRAHLAEGDHVVRPDNPIRASEYVATRVLEVTIHTMDVRDALGLAPDPSPEGLAVTLGILRRRLGEDPIELGFDGVDFIILSTGRREMNDHDRARLGMPATRLPLLA